MLSGDISKVYDVVDIFNINNIYNISNASLLDIDCGISIAHFRDFTQFMTAYVAPFLIIGVPINILIFVVFSVGELAKGTTSMLFRIMAVLDAAVVFVVIGLHFIPLHFWGSVFSFTDTTCKILTYFYPICRAMAAWTLVIIGLERVIGLTWPHRAYTLCTRQIFGTIIICIGVAHCVLYGPLLASAKTEFDYNIGERACYIHNLPGLSHDVFLCMDIFLGALLPMIALTINNILIFLAIRHSSNIRRQSYAGNMGPQQDHVIPMLVTASSVFFVLRLPFVVAWIVEMNSAKQECLLKEVAPHLAALGSICDGINHSINMFLYCLCGRNVRNQLRVIFLCIWSKK